MRSGILFTIENGYPTRALFLDILLLRRMLFMQNLKHLSGFVIVALYPFGLTPKYPLSLYTGMPLFDRSIYESWVLAVVTV
jgi:hypothetical protein